MIKYDSTYIESQSIINILELNTETKSTFVLDL